MRVPIAPLCSSGVSVVKSMSLPVLVGAVLLGVARRGEAATVTVTNTTDLVNGDVSSIDALIANDGGDGISLREAVLAANARPGPDTINFKLPNPSTITLDGLNGSLNITDTLTISGPGSGALTVRANASGFRAAVTMAEFTCEGCTISGFSPLFSLQPNRDGGAILANAPLTLRDCVISNNYGEYGGGIYGTYPVTIENCTVSGNHAYFGGGVMHRGFGKLTINASTISGNDATAGKGQGVAGGIVAIADTLEMSDCVVDSNYAFDVGGILSAANTTLSRCTISGNNANNSVGGIYAAGGYRSLSGSVIITDCTVTHNYAGSKGQGDVGGVAVFGSGNSVISGCTINNNYSYAIGGLFLAGSVSVVNTTVSGNSASYAAGGVSTSYVYSGPVNTYPVAAAKLPYSFSIKFQNCTITGNYAGSYGGGLNTGGGTRRRYAPTVSVANTIIAGNYAQYGADVDGSIISNNSLIQDTSSGVYITSGANNIYGIDPLLGPLQNNGGPTMTHLPGKTSVVIDAGGDSGGLTTDQRGAGFPRVIGSTADIGAIEVNTTAPLVRISAPPVDQNSNGAPYDFTITYSDETAIDASTIPNAVVQVSGPNGFVANATIVSVTPAGNAASITVTYRITPPGGVWDASDRGIYTVTVPGGIIADTAGNVVPVTSAVFGVATAALPGEVDFDGDGFTDEEEAALGTSIADPNSTPFGGKAAGAALPFTLKSLKLTLGFSGKDSIRMSGSLPVGNGVASVGTTMVFDIGGVILPIVTKSNGRALYKNGNTTATLAVANGKKLGSQNLGFALRVSGTDLEGAFADEGLTPGTVEKKPVNIVVRVLYGNTLYRQVVKQAYSASGTTGRTK